MSEVNSKAMPEPRAGKPAASASDKVSPPVRSDHEFGYGAVSRPESLGNQVFIQVDSRLVIEAQPQGSVDSGSSAESPQSTDSSPSGGGDE